MQKGRKFSSLIQYFEHIARNHVQIRHNDSDKHFFRLELDEIINGLRNIKGINLSLEGYSLSFLDHKSDNPEKCRTLAFVLTHSVKPGNIDQIHQAWDTLEEIGDEILCRMREDKRDTSSPVRNFDLDSVEATLMSFDPSLYGIRYMFQINSFFATSTDSTKWLDKQ